MILQCIFTLKPNKKCYISSEISYYLYAYMLSCLSPELGDRLHQNRINPISQYITYEKGNAKWHISVAGEWYIREIMPWLEQVGHMDTKHGNISWEILNREIRYCSDPSELLQTAQYADRHWKMRFVTPTAFKRQGVMICLPEMKLIVNNLVSKWNVCFPECPIEDTDGQGITSIANGLHCIDFRIESKEFAIKNRRIRGFVGTLTIDNDLFGDYRQLANALFLFAEYVGVGTKTTLGMGGVQLG